MAYRAGSRAERTAKARDLVNRGLVSVKQAQAMVSKPSTNTSRTTTSRTTTTTKPKPTPVEVEEAYTPNIVPQGEITEEVATPTPTTTVYDPTADIQAASEAQKKAQIEGLKRKLQTAQQGIAETRAGLPEQYGEQRRKASVQSRMGARSFQEYLANKGIARGGESDQARLMQNMALQGQLGGIDRQQQAEMDRLGREERGLQQAYESDVLSAQAGIDAQAMQNLINARSRQADIGRQDLIRQEGYDRQDALREQQQRSNVLAQQGVLDIYGGQRLTPEQLGQVSQYSDNYALALQDPNLDPQTRALIEQARYEKVTGSPDMMSQYGRDYMTPQAKMLQEQQYAQSIAGNVIPDYQAEINRVAGDNDPTNDWQLPLLQAERQRKIAGIQAAEQAQQEAMKKEAFDIIDTIGYVPEQYADIVGLPAGTRTSDQKYKDAQIGLGYAKIADAAAARQAKTTSPTSYKPTEREKNTLKRIITVASTNEDDETGYVDIDKALSEIQKLEAQGTYTQDALDYMAAQLGIQVAQ